MGILLAHQTARGAALHPAHRFTTRSRPRHHPPRLHTSPIMLGALASKVGFSNGRAFDVDKELPDLTGKVAVVTGGNDGIGFITVRALWRKGCKVYLACRSEEKARNAIARLAKEEPGKEDQLVFL